MPPQPPQQQEKQQFSTQMGMGSLPPQLQQTPQQLQELQQLGQEMMQQRPPPQGQQMGQQMGQELSSLQQLRAPQQQPLAIGGGDSSTSSLRDAAIRELNEVLVSQKYLSFAEFCSSNGADLRFDAAMVGLKYIEDAHKQNVSTLKGTQDYVMKQQKADLKALLDGRTRTPQMKPTLRSTGGSITCYSLPRAR